MASGDELDQTQSQSQNTQENAWVNVDDEADIWGRLFCQIPLFNEENATNPIGKQMSNQMLLCLFAVNFVLNLVYIYKLANLYFCVRFDALNVTLFQGFFKNNIH